MKGLRVTRDALAAAALMLLCGAVMLSAQENAARDGEGGETPAGVVEWVDVTGADPADVEQAVEVLVNTFSGDYEGAGFFIVRSGSRVAVYGGERERKIAREILENLAPSGPPRSITRIMPVRPETSEEEIEGLLGGEGAPEAELRDNYLVLRGSADQVEMGEALLTQAGVAVSEAAPVCETIRLYYVRAPQSLQELLSQLPPSVAEGVTVLASGEVEGPPVLIISGPRKGVQNLKRVIATLDVPQPEVRLDIWAFQISGRNADDVARRAAMAQQRIDAIA
ncbi:MAG: hypothetical protein J7M38_16005, partial [Armatimonadetes bacterium]|nr:hypothetical protein [Armatimonadota bacterium]